MNITFSGKYAVNDDTFGINFDATVDGQQVVCSVSTEALDDVNPNDRHNGMEQKFIENQIRLQDIAREKIIRYGATSGVITIDSPDVRA